MEPTRQESTRYDPSRLRQGVRKGRERGIWIFIPAAELRAAGLDPAAAPPRYRLWGRKKGTVLVYLSRATATSADES